MTDPKRLSVNQICVLPQWTLRQAVEGLARHEVAAISVWREKLHEAGVAEGKRLIDGNGLGISGLCFAGLISSADRAAAATALDDVRRALDEAAAIGAPCLVFLSGGLDPNDKDLNAARARVLEGMSRLTAHARQRWPQLAGQSAAAGLMARSVRTRATTPSSSASLLGT